MSALLLTLLLASSHVDALAEAPRVGRPNTIRATVLGLDAAQCTALGRTKTPTSVRPLPPALCGLDGDLRVLLRSIVPDARAYDAIGALEASLPRSSAVVLSGELVVALPPDEEGRARLLADPLGKPGSECLCEAWFGEANGPFVRLSFRPTGQCSSHEGRKVSPAGCGEHPLVEAARGPDGMAAAVALIACLGSLALGIRTLLRG